jgi:hypothetical protein
MNIPYLLAYKHYLPCKFIQYCNFTAHFVLSNIGLSMLFPYYIAVDSTPNRDVSKRSKKSKQHVRSKWDAPGYIPSHYKLVLGRFAKNRKIASPILLLPRERLEWIQTRFPVKRFPKTAKQTQAEAKAFFFHIISFKSVFFQKIDKY